MAKKTVRRPPVKNQPKVTPNVQSKGPTTGTPSFEDIFTMKAPLP